MIDNMKRSLPDPLYLYSLAARRSSVGAIRFFAKEEIRSYFPFGSAMALIESIFLERKWYQDEKSIYKAFEDVRQHPDVPLWMVSFLEGRRLTPQLKQEADEFARGVRQ